MYIHIVYVYCGMVPQQIVVCVCVCVCVCSYNSALSEMAVHTWCKGVAMILGKPDNNQSQVRSSSFSPAKIK